VAEQPEIDGAGNTSEKEPHADSDWGPCSPCVPCAVLWVAQRHEVFVPCKGIAERTEQSKGLDILEVNTDKTICAFAFQNTAFAGLTRLRFGLAVCAWASLTTVVHFSRAVALTGGAVKEEICWPWPRFRKSVVHENGA
jgi:hypothetical protein